MNKKIKEIDGLEICHKGMLMLFVFFVCSFFCINLYRLKSRVISNSDIVVEHDSIEQMARITIKDQFTKDGIKYFVFTTDVSDNKEFTMSEIEYDKYIGLGNDAVDCTIYKLNLEMPIYEYKTAIGSNLPSKYYEADKLWDIFDKINDVQTYGLTVANDSTIYIKNTCKTNFDMYNYKVFVHTEKSNSILIGDDCTLNEKMTLKRYSFIGESDFSEEEISDYCEIMKNVKTNIVNIVEK